MLGIKGVEGTWGSRMPWRTWREFRPTGIHPISTLSYTESKGTKIHKSVSNHFLLVSPFPAQSEHITQHNEPSGLESVLESTFLKATKFLFYLLVWLMQTLPITQTFYKLLLMVRDFKSYLEKEK